MERYILLAIDDEKARASARDYLNRNGYFTSAVPSREAIDRVCRHHGAACLIVDVDGGAEEALRMCCGVRCVSAVPIIVLSSSDDSEERIRGFDAGADDYLVKPFHPRELIARIRAVSRRAALARRQSYLLDPPGSDAS